MSLEADLGSRKAKARAWLFDQALPVWSTHGVNPRGGFHDRLDADLSPSGGLRLRVQARQTYVFAEAGRLGWQGPWRPLVEHGLTFLLHRATNDEGLAAGGYDAEGRTRGAPVDLYDQGFALLAYAHAFDVLGDARAKAAALALLEALERSAHPGGGYREFGRAGLNANPHMHLFEALLAWSEVDGDPVWARTAESLAVLCETTLVDPAGPALREHFDDDWRPEPGPRGERIEPGHHFEWAWLLNRSGRPAAGLPERLCDLAEQSGVDAGRGVAVNCVDTRGEMVDAEARLWPQTERLKAALILARADPEPWAARAAQAFDGLFAYIDPAPSGLWYDVMDAQGGLRVEPAPASSLYHIVGALSELLREPPVR